jgi:F0F1-type ATP synthase membrane subunit b/b'
MQREDDHGRKTADFQTAKSEVSERFEQETRSASEALHDARDELTRKAGDYASDAKQVLIDKAEGTQRDLSANLKAFGGALRAASEHLANSDQRTASKFALDAAGGLERLSSSLKDKPFEEVLGEIQSFGRENSGALIAGSVLAGLALGRFIKSSSPTSPADTGAPSQGGGTSASASSSNESGSNEDWADASLELNP